MAPLKVAGLEVDENVEAQDLHVEVLSLEVMYHLQVAGLEVAEDSPFARYLLPLHAFVQKDCVKLMRACVSCACAVRWLERITYVQQRILPAAGRPQSKYL